jgi:hypothetical protein
MTLATQLAVACLRVALACSTLPQLAALHLLLWLLLSQQRPQQQQEWPLT